MRILLAEDDEATALVVGNHLTQQGYVVDVVGDGETAWDLLESAGYELAILDVMLPDLDGITLCRRLRTRALTVPVLLLTARDSAQDKVAGLDAGADDYLVKPVELGELAARLRALLRRKKETLLPVLAVGALRLDSNAHEVTYAGRDVVLTRKEYGLLELFMRNPLRLYSRSDILAQLWPFEEAPEEDTVKAHVKGLRQKLKAAGAPEMIETVYGTGYRLKVQAPSIQPTVPVTSEERRQKVLAALAETWERYKPRVHERLAVLDEAGRSVLKKTLGGALRLRAEGEAHKLVGYLGTFGLLEASRLSREIEQMLGSGLHLLSLEQAARFAELLVGLHGELESIHPSLEGPVDGSLEHLLVVHDRNPDFAPLIEELARCGLQVAEAHLEPDSIREAIRRRHPDAVLLDLADCAAGTADGNGAAHALLLELSTRTPPIPTVVVASSNDLARRVEIARLGARAFLRRPVSPQKVLQALRQVGERERAAGAKVLIVDDDPELLSLLRLLLKPLGLQLETVSEPSKFWTALETFSPQLLVLDVQMPDLNGIELCRVVRADPHWHLLPVIFLTAHTDAETERRAFAGGADDFLGKPVDAAELATRILNRLGRSQPKAGVPN